MTKKEVLENLDTVNTYIQEIENEKTEIKKVKIQIKNRWTGNIIFESEKSTIKEAVIEGLASEADLRGANLSGADLSEADLRGANLSDANLSEADLREADLSGANLSGANLREADLRGTNLREADLREADLSGANLSGANLRGADLSEADLSGANLREANLREADLSGAELNNAKFYGKTSNPKILTKKQLPDFLAALGFKIEE
jgi:uncharacterized protein YjbI with pentapeptide repeats